MSYEPMVRAESELAGEVEALLADAARLVAAKDAAYGPAARSNAEQAVAAHGQEKDQITAAGDNGRSGRERPGPGATVPALPDMLTEPVSS
jgi:hypothetical protein